MMHRELDAIETLLLRWADSMRPWEGNQGYPGKASGGFIASWCRDAEEQAEELEADECSRIDACIHDLPAQLRNVIYKRFNVGYLCWRWKDEMSVFQQAKAAIEPLLRKRNLL